MEKFRFYIEDIDDSTKYELKHACGGWSDYGVNYGRETQISNVVKSYTDGWDFYKEDAEWIKDRFYKYGANRRLRLVVEHLKSALKGEYEIAYRGYLDLTNIEIRMNSVNLPTMESGFFKALENKWSEEYEFDYDTYCKINGNVFSEKAEFSSNDTISVTDDSPEAVAGKTSVSFLVGGEISNSDDVSDKIFQSTNLQYLNLGGGILNGKIYMDESGAARVGNTQSFMKVNGSQLKKLNLNWDFLFRLNCINLLDYTNNISYLESKANLSLVVFPLIEGGQYLLTESEDLKTYPLQEVAFEGKFNEDGNYTFNVPLNGNMQIDDIDYGNREYGMFLCLQVTFGKEVKNGSETGHSVFGRNGSIYNARFTNFSFSSSYEMVLNEKSISTIKSTSLFERLIDKINDGKYDVVCDMSDFLKVAKDDLITSNRGMKWNLKDFARRKRSYSITGNIKTSLQKFLDYCYAVYNYQLAVDYDMQSDKYRVYLAHFDNMYDGQRQIAKLGGVNDVSMQLWRDVMYTQIEVGYEVSDDAINADREFNCKFTFRTPNTEIEESTLQLVSPYNASTRDFETELYLHYHDEDDDSNDNVYIIAAKFWKTYIDGREFYEIDRSIEVEEGSLFPSYEWNVKFSPKRMLLAHARELFSYLAFNVGSDIEFSLCDHNSELVADGIKENGNVEIGGNILFRPLVVSVASKGDVDYIKAIDANRLGYISFMYKGREVRGFLAKDSGAVNIKPMREQRSEYRLLLAANSEFRI